MSGSASVYLDFLRNNGYRPQLDGDGDIAFFYNDRKFFLMIDSDPENRQLLQILAPNICPINSNAVFSRAIMAANHATRSAKCAKVYIRTDQQNVHASIELLFAEPGQFAGVFQTAISCLFASMVIFAQQMS